jgi:hypothetical protein
VLRGPALPARKACSVIIRVTRGFRWGRSSKSSRLVPGFPRVAESVLKPKGGFRLNGQARSDAGSTGASGLKTGPREPRCCCTDLRGSSYSLVSPELLKAFSNPRLACERTRKRIGPGVAAPRDASGARLSRRGTRRSADHSTDGRPMVRSPRSRRSPLRIPFRFDRWGARQQNRWNVPGIVQPQKEISNAGKP